jgi:NAD(P)-dependent dehydrogenase (short-subunit alcohol dehydrogenase family)
MSELSGKTAIVTGSSRGIGKATAVELAKHGACVVIASRSFDECKKTAKEINSSGGKALAVECDVTKTDEIETLLNKTLNWRKKIDILVNNAAIIEPVAYITDCKPQDWLNNININVSGVFNVTHFVLKHFLKNKEGVIVNLSSGAALHALTGWSAYCAGKAAVSMFTQSINLEYASKNISAYAVRPGVIYTDMLKKAINAGMFNMAEKDCLPAEAPAKLITWLCIKRPGDLAGKMADIFDDKICKRAGIKIPVK